MNRNNRMRRIIGLAASLAVVMMLTPGCAPDPVVGDINDQASIALISFETQEDGIAGVVYRDVLRLPALLAASKQPVLVAFYARQDLTNTQVIPLLEQMADDYRDQLQIVWIDAEAQADIAASFQVKSLPQFTVVQEAVLQRSLVGFDENGATRLAELLDPFLES